MPRKILQENPRQNPPNFMQQKSPTHSWRGARPKNRQKMSKAIFDIFRAAPIFGPLWGAQTTSRFATAQAKGSWKPIVCLGPLNRPPRPASQETQIARMSVRHALSTTGNSMTSSERPSPEPLLKKETSSAVLRGRELWKCSRSLNTLNYRAWGIPAVPSRGIPGYALRAFLGSFRNFSWNFFW